MPLVVTRSFVARHFGLALDGSPNCGFLKSVEGGAIKGDPITQMVGGDIMKVKHIGMPKYDPLTVGVGMAMSKDFYKWIAASWDGDVQRKHGAVITMDRDLNVVHEQHFYNALVTETTIPALDGSSKEPAYMTVKFQGETLRHKLNPGGKFGAKTPPDQKTWLPANFRLDIQGLNCKKVAKIDSFTIKQNTKLLEIGPERDYQLEPTSIEFPDLVVTLSLTDSKTWFDWHEDFVIKGNNTVDKEKEGAIHFLSPSRDKELMTVELKGVGITSLQVDKGDGTTDAIKRIKVGLYVEKMHMDYGD
jgi:phage tail-like protein